MVLHNILKHLLVWINQKHEGIIVAFLPDGSEYGIVHDYGNGFLPYYHPSNKLGGYLDHNLNIVAGIGETCAKGPHPDTICQTQEAQNRCQKHYTSKSNQ